MIVEIMHPCIIRCNLTAIWGHDIPAALTATTMAFELAPWTFWITWQWGHWCGTLLGLLVYPGKRVECAWFPFFYQLIESKKYLNYIINDSDSTKNSSGMPCWTLQCVFSSLPLLVLPILWPHAWLSLLVSPPFSPYLYPFSPSFPSFPSLVSIRTSWTSFPFSPSLSFCLWSSSSSLSFSPKGGNIQ